MVNLIKHWAIGLNLLILLSLKGYAQEFKGRVTDENGNAVAFAYVVLKNSTSVSYTNENGEFTCALKKGILLDTLLIKMLGYKDYIALLEEKTQEEYLKIKLNLVPYALPQHTVKGIRKSKKLLLGSFTKNTNRRHMIQVGEELAMQFHCDTFPSLLKQVWLNLTFEASKANMVARINVYEMDALTHLPGRQILSYNINTRSTTRSRLTKIDLEKEYVAIGVADFFVGVELVQVDKVSNANNLTLLNGDLGFPIGMDEEAKLPMARRWILKNGSLKWIKDSSKSKSSIIIGLELAY